VSSPAPVLLIAAETGEREELVEMLERRGHPVIQAEGAAQARAILQEQSDVAIVLDLARPEALRFLRAPMVQRAGVPVICVADRRRPDASSEALRLGIADLVSRPVREDDLTAAIANAREFAETARLPREERERPLESAAGTVFGASPAIREALALARRIAPSRCHVLMIGERGTGRESMARVIHGLSPRNEAPFLRMDCAGASAPDVRALVVDVPAGATVYLDHLSALEMSAQRELADLLLRTGAEPGGTPRFIGGTRPRVDDAVARGDLHAELAETLGVVRIELPPLRQRTEDIPLLAIHFLKEACRRQGIPPKTFSRSALTVLAALPWPGNAAELRALAERLAVLITRGVVLLEDVLASVRLDGSETLAGSSGTLREARERFERKYVASVLQQHRGRMGDAARELGIERTNLYRKIKQLNIRWTTAD
jgi:DNA-binding NtrC family response regulator